MGVMNNPSLRPLIRHLLRKCHLPPLWGEGFAGGHMGPYRRSADTLAGTLPPDYPRFLSLTRTILSFLSFL